MFFVTGRVGVATACVLTRAGCVLTAYVTSAIGFTPTNMTRTIRFVTFFHFFLHFDLPPMGIKRILYPIQVSVKRIFIPGQVIKKRIFK